MQLLHFYVQKGFDWEKIINADTSEKLFLKASMETAIEEEIKRYEALTGGGK